MADPPPTNASPNLHLLFFFFILLRCAAADPDDVVCLTKFYSALQDPSNSLRNWTRHNLASPCDGFDTHLTGATCNNGRVFKLSLSSFSLSGSISPFLSNCSFLQGLDLSSNFLSGPIPSDLRLLQNLALLNLSSNRLSGPIPPDISSCTYLNLLDLHDNRLTGPIPVQFGLLARLSTFDVSNNRLQGMIPPSLANRTSTLPRFNASSFQGNKDLYGFPLSPYKGGKGLSLMAIVAIGVGSGLLSLIVSFTVVCVWLRVSERKMAAEEAKMSNLMPDY